MNLEASGIEHDVFFLKQYPRSDAIIVANAIWSFFSSGTLNQMLKLKCLCPKFVNSKKTVNSVSYQSINELYILPSKYDLLIIFFFFSPHAMTYTFSGPK